MVGRASTFTLPGLCDLIRDKCIPLAHNHQLSTGYEEDDAFLRSLGAGFVLCTAQGKILRSQMNYHQDFELFTKLSAAEKKPGAASIGPRGPLSPKLFVLNPPPNGLILRMFQRTLASDRRGQLSAPKKMDVGSGNWVPTEPQRDFVWLKEAEWKSLVPAQPRMGDSFAVPQAIQRRIFRFHLTEGPTGLPGSWGSADVRKGSLTLTVQSVSDRAIELRLEGTAFLADHADPAKANTCFDVRLLGVLIYDLARQRFDRIDMVAVGDSWNGKLGRAASRAPIGFAFELTTGELPADRRPPRGAWIDLDRKRGLDNYFRAD
jgi:hypothetical protein